MRGFAESLRQCAQKGRIPVIPDFKLISPSEGPLLREADAYRAAEAMERTGAPALSVVTEKEHFGGSMELLTRIAGTVGLPVLRKDFIRERADVEESARCGAKAVLLICACMGEEKLRELYDAALQCGLEPLVEVHTREELRLAAELRAGLVGINNRDILTLEQDGGTVETTRRLAAAKPDGAFLISESGIQGTGDVRIARQSGADAVLVGTAIWKAANPLLFYESLSRAGGDRP